MIVSYYSPRRHGRGEKRMNILHGGEVIMAAEREEPIRMAIGAPTPPVKSTDISAASGLGKWQSAVQCAH